MNVLILTAGSRVQTVTYFKRALAGRGRVITTDASALAPPLSAADGHHVVPLINDPEYLPTILRICRDEEISVALSLLDPELSLLAKHVDEFEAIGTKVMISPAEVVERAFDKWLMYQWLTAEGLPTPRSWIDMISGEVAAMFAKKKLRMRAGTADKSVSFKDDSLFALVEDFVTRCGFRGTIDVDLFSTPGGWSILEVNPRFGGVYPHAYECGVDFPSLLLNNVEGRANEPRIGDYESDWAMLGYDGVIMHRIEGLSER